MTEDQPASADNCRENFREGDKLFLVRCPSCNRENHSMSVASGQCAWCGWRENQNQP